MACFVGESFEVVQGSHRLQGSDVWGRQIEGGKFGHLVRGRLVNQADKHANMAHSRLLQQSVAHILPRLCSISIERLLIPRPEVDPTLMRAYHSCSRAFQRQSMPTKAPPPTRPLRELAAKRSGSIPSVLRLRGRGFSHFRLTLPYGSRTLEKGHDAAEKPPLPTGCPGGFFAARWRALHQEQSPLVGRVRGENPVEAPASPRNVLCEGRNEKIVQILVELEGCRTTILCQQITTEEKLRGVEK
jgi:hypothetical protein